MKTGSRPLRRHLPFGQRVEEGPPFRKFWLYIVAEAASDALRLQRIQNPAAHFQLGEDIFATGFILPEEK